MYPQSQYDKERNVKLKRQDKGYNNASILCDDYPACNHANPCVRYHSKLTIAYWRAKSDNQAGSLVRAVVALRDIDRVI
jgi:hypothetical protein